MNSLSKQELLELTKKWMKKHDPVTRFKNSPLYKKHLKIKLARTKAFKQEKAQKRSLRRK
jgi:hypothetical protein